MKVVNISQGSLMLLVGGKEISLPMYRTIMVDMAQEDFIRDNPEKVNGGYVLIVDGKGDLEEIKIVPEELPEEELPEEEILQEEILQEEVFQEEIPCTEENKAAEEIKAQESEEEEKLQTTEMPLREWENFLQMKTIESLQEFAQLKGIDIQRNLKKAKLVETIINWLINNDFIK